MKNLGKIAAVLIALSPAEACTPTPQIKKSEVAQNPSDSQKITSEVRSEIQEAKKVPHTPHELDSIRVEKLLNVLDEKMMSYDADMAALKRGMIWNFYKEQVVDWDGRNDHEHLNVVEFRDNFRTTIEVMYRKLQLTMNGGYYGNEPVQLSREQQKKLSYIHEMMKWLDQQIMDYIQKLSPGYPAQGEWELLEEIDARK